MSLTLGRNVTEIPADGVTSEVEEIVRNAVESREIIRPREIAGRLIKLHPDNGSSLDDIARLIAEAAARSGVAVLIE